MFLFTTLVYFITLIALAIYTQFLSDPNPWYGQTSGIIMTLILFSLTICYFYFLKHPPKKIWLYIIASAIIAFPAFPAALSRDVYNYAIYAKTLMVYHQNPWTTPPKAFPNDELLNHIHWPNDPSRYGPVWILPTSLIFAVFPSLYAFKLFTVICWLAVLYFIKNKKSLVFLAFNPLMIIEYYYGTHTDIAMTLLALIALLRGSWLTMLGSILIKITSLPLFAGLIIKNKHFWVWLAYFGSLIIIAKWSINAWYFTAPIVLTSLIVESKFYKWLAISLSTAAAIRYLPLLFMGPFDPNNKIRAMLFLLAMLPFAVWTLWLVVANIRKQISALENRSTY